MKEVKCIENSVNDAVLVKPDEILYFPNVDSCLSITYVLDNFLVGGHVPLFSKTSQVPIPEANFSKVFRKMDMIKMLHAKGAIKMTLLIGEYDTENFRFAPTALQNSNNLVIIDNSKGQAHVRFTPSKNGIILSIKIKEQEYCGKRITDLERYPKINKI